MFENLLSNLNNSKYFSGIMMVLLNLGSKYVSLDLSEAQQHFLSDSVVRKVLLFTIFFIATKDIIISIILSLVFGVLVFGVLHEDSRFCIAKHSLKKFCKNRKNKVSLEEYTKALKVVNEYTNQNKHNNLNK